ncbi:MAG: long-chain fatty acid--CoA ligase [Verrucomicrobiales bacterium]|nr:long-chain fatty acid--CoA ligase [Verrucomicrobiales bacterium]|tara:strand:- start:7756 stop:9252 length:1497 start_codon:yes stop_codon:yes gene_type:complete
MPELELFKRALAHENAVAFRTDHGERHYSELLECSEQIARILLDGGRDLDESRIAFLIPTGFDHTSAQWGIWRAGGVAVPLCLAATTPEYEYTITDSDASVVFTTRELSEKLVDICKQHNLRLLILEDLGSESNGELPELNPERRAMILYTSGTTSKPKGVVSTHRNIQAQIEMLVKAWEWQADDRIPLFLPLHHIHGIINVMSCALWSGAVIEPFAGFDLERILKRVADDAYTVFMAVPTIYVKLIQALETQSAEQRDRNINGFQKMRLMISGSAALPASIHEKWTELTGQKLLERYGMTEIGMGLSNPFHGERRPGAVGQPLPGVEIRLKAETGEVVTNEDEPGEIQVKGPAVFSEYWNRPEVTAESFEDAWFRTGDMAVLETGYYRIMGRLSVDIIKSGGYKLSALEIEAVLLQHPDISECAVIGTPDDTWGEAVSAAVVLAQGTDLELEALRNWCRDRLSVYKIPKRLSCVNALPRNAMGKVTKPAVKDLFAES